MRLRTSSMALASFMLLSLSYLPAALAHGGDEIEGTDGDHGAHGGSNGNGQPADDARYPPTYFAHPEHSAQLYTHVAFMVLAWVFMLPVAVMLSLARSRYTLFAQILFTLTNGVGLLLAIIYNAQTPDLYPNNAHHSVGWVVSWLAFAQLTVSIPTWVSRRTRGHLTHAAGPERGAFLPLATAPGDDQQSTHRTHLGSYRLSNDEGEEGGSGRSQRNSSASTVIDEDEGLPMPSPYKEYEEGDEVDFDEGPLVPSHIGDTWTRRVWSAVSSRTRDCFSVAYNTIDRIILPLGFIALTTGIATVGRLFEGKAIFNGLAHWVKGGVFFWLGLLTLARWSGSFGDLGWAWNIRPRSDGSNRRPSAEFIECALIFFYGSTNIFLEHLGSWGGDWSAQDFEHLAITVLFIGGGLCGMLIESTRIRELLNVATVEAVPDRSYSNEEERGQREEPATYKFSLNPIPALVILLLGVMMSSHHQNTMISTMVHKQWGNLLVGASFARGLTYLLVFLRPPTSILPSRPPTELLASFGLIAGGIVFMASSSDTIEGMIHYDLDAMFMYTVTMGLVGLLMAWEIVVLAIKGFAARRERRATMARFK